MDTKRAIPERKNQTSDESIKMVVIMIVLAVFSVFYVLKINGKLDFTGKYGIEEIVVDEMFRNDKVLMLDGNRGTTWGKDETRSPGDCMDFRFVKEKEISSVWIVNSSEIASAPIKIYVSLDGLQYNLVPCEVKLEKETTIYSFDTAQAAKYLRLEYNGVDGGNWPITEVIINGEKR